MSVPAGTPVQISHDGFARTSLYRITLPVYQRQACVTCGSQNGRFVYYVRSDDRRAPQRPPFPGAAYCSAACFRQDS